MQLSLLLGRQGTVKALWAETETEAFGLDYKQLLLKMVPLYGHHMHCSRKPWPWNDLLVTLTSETLSFGQVS